MLFMWADWVTRAINVSSHYILIALPYSQSYDQRTGFPLPLSLLLVDYSGLHSFPAPSLRDKKKIQGPHYCVIL